MPPTPPTPLRLVLDAIDADVLKNPGGSNPEICVLPKPDCASAAL
jgi:hypothetical protein